jgi:antitoxin component of RelBE/YafQ-DinJ toxin-antitoxin module
MNTAGIYVKTQPEVKAKAQKIAKALGMSLGSLMNTWLRQLVKTKKVTFGTEEERPSKYLIESIKKSEEELRRGETSPAFDNAKDAIDWLEKQGI